MNLYINWPVFDFGTRRVLSQKVAAFPVLRWSDWSRNKATAAIWTDVAQNVFDTCGAECTLIGTDACLERIGWQRLVAMLTGGPEFKHGVLHS